MGNTISYETTPTTLSLGLKGSVKGLQFSNKSIRFAGVPYALPPTGEYRWRKPRPLPESHQYDEFDATEFKNPCWQKLFGKVAKAEGTEAQYSEDCLLLNIWTPALKDGETLEGRKLPVVLWLHGGWFQMGDPSQEPGMDPIELISTGGLNAIFIAIGYRLNIFGFLAGSALLEDSDGAAAGNCGLWDQRLAMEWVQENIQHFGGDPNNIVLGGRSGGAYGVEAQVLHEMRNPACENLIKKFYMLSNAIPAQPKTVAETESQFDEVCTYFNLPASLPAKEKLARLRHIPAKDLVDALERMKNHTFRPVTDDLFIHSNLIEFLTSGRFAKTFKDRGMKLLIGEVLNEESLYAEYNSPEQPILSALQHQLENYYAPSTVERILPSSTLPSSSSLQPWKSLYGTIAADGQVRAPSRFLAKKLFENGVGVDDVWRYLIAYRMGFIDESVAPGEFGVAHAMDKPFWNFSITHGPSAEERALMEEWIEILVAFVHGDEEYEFGTKRVDEVKVATPEKKIEIWKDERWEDLSKLGGVFASA
ncbi:hypothetical protein M409DRAFT_25978 [Zasmidium cellare ATCC 36951]|uniref:Carboxylic ester hydrolase n=1 Tax=Zasmidium cellare ATCC 36951 TaxID=1080233 RepID=A0A6A6C9D7_ZASCE|nr:uncharacterized protein M409DRAFT_25978 [Zasmidium cellare ATCC 36951]KAF2163797.1 hypothetical protein M409DRAFT_25978 [Zasmidium cellare ATCC 36951]